MPRANRTTESLHQLVDDLVNQQGFSVPKTVAILQYRFSADYVRYWAEKARNPAFHPETWGGARNVAFPPDAQLLVEDAILQLRSQEPGLILPEYVEKLEDEWGIFVGRKYVSRVLDKWQLTRKKIDRFHINKFTPQNMLRYQQHLEIAATIFPAHRIKYLDESHFESRSLQRKRGRAQRGEPAEAYLVGDLADTFSITLVTDLTRTPPFYVSDLREGSNTADDFLLFIAEIVTNEVLVPGDYLVMDNATIHDAEPILDDLVALLAAAGVTPLFLPTYSPELNPCELVFGETKSYLYHRRGKDRFWREIMKSFAKVTREHMCNYYVHCILGPLLGLF